MTKRKSKKAEPGSDDQMTDEQKERLATDFDRKLAEELEEERKTAARPTTEEDPS